MIDWILAERIAGYVAGTGDAAAPTADLSALANESEKRVTAYTGDDGQDIGQLRWTPDGRAVVYVRGGDLEFLGRPDPNPSADPAHHVTLSWNASMSSGVLGYNVYRGTESGGPYIKLNPSIVVSTNYRDNNVQSGQTYYYVVKATDSSNVESLRADEVAARVP